MTKPLAESLRDFCLIANIQVFKPLGRQICTLSINYPLEGDGVIAVEFERTLERMAFDDEETDSWIEKTYNAIQEIVENRTNGEPFICELFFTNPRMN